MKLRVPEYYERFCCTASACQDNCCIGWEIDIDADSDRRYRQVEGTFGQRLRESIQREGDASCFRLVGERCVFLNDQNLCEIILHLGEEGLCQICRDHPRFTETFGELREIGVGLCCPEAGRLLFASSEPVHFIVKEVSEGAIAGECRPERLQALLAVRETLLRVLQNRALPLTERLCQALEIAQRAQEALEEENWLVIAALPELWPKPSALSNGEMVQLLTEWLEKFSTLEPINEGWIATLERAKKCLTQPGRDLEEQWWKFRHTMVARGYEYEHLMVYFLFRYFLKAVYTGDCLTPVQLAVVSCLMVGMLDLTRFWERQTFTETDRIQVVGLYSKQMEYSEENLAALEEWLIFDDQFSCRKMEEILTAAGKRD